MGGSKGFAERNEYKYKSIGTVEGIKVLAGLRGEHNLPKYSDTSTAYVKMGKSKGDTKDSPRTIRIFKNGEVIKDIDWGHDHDSFKKGEIHVHEYTNGARNRIVRKPSRKERRLGIRVRNGTFISKR